MVTRRNFLVTMALVALSGYSGNVFGLDKKERVIELYNIHTCERIKVKYYYAGNYDRESLDQINYLMRCHYTNEVKSIDPNVIDLLCDIKDVVDRNKEVHIISGYRSHQYNEYLRGMGRGVACNSLHLQGRAIDFRIPRVDNRKLSVLARSFYSGGVGTYPEFIHIDDGRIRYW